MDKKKLLQEMETNFEEISVCMKEMQDDVHKLSGCVEMSQFVPNALIGDIMTKLTNLQKANAKCQESYEAFSEEKFAFDKIDDFKTMLEAAKVEIASLDTVCKANEFFKLKASNEEIMALLDKQKEILKGILSETESEDINAKVQPYGDFVDAVKLEDSKDAFNKVAPHMMYFGQELVFEAFNKPSKMTFDDNLEVVTPQNGFQDKPTITEEKSTSASETEASNKAKEPEPDVQNAASAEDTPNTEEAEPCLLFEAAKVNGCMIPADYDYGKFNVDVFPKATGSFGVSELKSDIKKSGYGMMEKHILERLALDYYINESNVVKRMDKPNEDFVRNAADHLIRRGYVKRYTVGNFGSFYAPSQRGHKAFKSAEAKKFLELKNIDYDGTSETLPDCVEYAVPRLAYTSMFGQLFYDKEHDGKTLLPSFSSESFFGVFSTQGVAKEQVLYVGMFYNETCTDPGADIDFGENEEKRQKNLSKFACIIIAGLTKDYAAKNYKALLEVCPELSNVNPVLYSLSDNAFYDFDLNAISVDDVWAKFGTDDDNPEPPENTPEDGPKKTPDESPKAESEKTQKDVTIFEELAKELDDATSGVKGAKEPSLTIGKAVVTTEQKESADIISNDSQAQASLSAFYLTKEEVAKKVFDMLKKDKGYAALAYIKACSEADSAFDAMYNRLAYALNDPMHKYSYASDQVYSLFGDTQSVFDDYLLAASAMRTFFYSHMQYDYSMSTLYDGYIRNLSVVTENQSIGNLIFSLMKFKEANRKGVDSFADYRTKSSKVINEKLAEVCHTAKEFYEGYVAGVIKDDGLPLYVDACKLIFSKKNDLGKLIKSVADGEKDSDTIELIETYLSDFIKDNCTVNAVNINPDAIDELIDDNWSKAGAKKSAPLTSSRRQRLYNLIFKAITILCDWVDCVNRIDASEDPSAIAYQRIRGELIKSIEDILKKYSAKKKRTDEVAAGEAVVATTVLELKSRIEGDYDELSSRYFFIDFLKSNQIILDENYLPVFETGLANVKGISSADRIEKHVCATEESFKDRLEDIFSNQGDDYGSADLILQYLADYPDSDINESDYNLSESIKYARREFEGLEDDFIGTLEYMQNDGLINSPVEDIKEKYIQISHEIYEQSDENNNFGYYKRIISSIEAQIKEEACAHGDELRKRVKLLKTEYKNNEKALNKLAQAENNIADLHYSAAEDIISRIDKDEDDVVDIFQTDYLADFMREDRYGFYYEMVKGTNMSLSQKLSRKRYVSNKDTKAASVLIDNWPANGGNPNEEQIRRIFSALGFNLKDKTGIVKRQNDILGLYPSFHVVCSEPDDNQISRIKHPIAPFGSSAYNEDIGFRVVWVTGNRDADRMVKVIRDIGDAEDTIILMDQAIELSERRTLARKLKEGSSNKIKAIIDRVILMYLIDNYNKDDINNMLMQIMMPFAYYQPYIPDSSHIMPPDMFMGRSDELQKIKSPDGVNIVYGGRQLGKSRLLEMAKREIDNNSRGDRAVYVSIRGLGYKDAARKVCQKLADEDIIPVTVDTDDWNKLAQAITARLRDTNDKIPYLLLLIDEADAFIRSCDEVDYLPFDALKEIQSVGVGRFKFVIAGLRDIVRFNKKGALGNNSVIPHFSAMKVLPFEFKEANELLKKPLYYLGFRFPKEDDVFETQIFAKANYFPGLIQLYCKKLIEAMRETDYATYNEVDTPPYVVQKGHVRKVLADREFNNEVWTKFNITLKDGDDDYYEIIALLMALLYHEDGRIEGYTPFDIFNAADDLDIKKLSALDVDTVRAFMDELCELNILKKTLKDSDNYWFLRTNFFQMMGSKVQIEDKLLQFLEA